jgi:oligoribonuclease (3'-5' exoribonuclease)
MLTPIISLDLETTGLEPSRHGPWEIAWAVAVHDTERKQVRVLNRQQWFVSLTGNEQLDPVALRIGGFHERYAQLSAQGRRLPWWAIHGLLMDDLTALSATVAETLEDGVHTPPTHLVGACPQFDHRMLERWLGWAHRHWHHHLIDVETLLAGKHQLPYPINTKHLTELACGPDWVNPWGAQHEALADVRWNLELYREVYEIQLVIPDTMKGPL